ncbi:MAG: beta-ketoacyl-[acyl-carrier-protein] synthase family protein [Victivallaceae bacterium]|nr:beta-ketoacyl-[acyl-carrier-protein] synthase family protein [Victivallaceae bacterium]
MESVYITGRGLVTPLGTGLPANEEALRSGKSGIVTIPSFVEHQLTSQVGGLAQEDVVPNFIDRKKLRFCSPVGLMSVIAVEEALAEAGFQKEELPSLRIAIITGVAASSYHEIYAGTATYMKEMKLRTVSPVIIPRVMPSSAASVLSLAYGITGEMYDISAACATSAIAVMVGARLVQSGAYDLVIAGGAEQLDWIEALGFNAIRALSTNFNDDPPSSSRPFDKRRDGFVLASGAAYVILESEAHLKKRGGRPVSRIAGFASNSNGKDMVVPDADSSRDVMLAAIRAAGIRPQDVNYINTHGTATPVGDPVEMAAIESVFKGCDTAINSTKSQTGHMVGATGAAELIFSSIMLEKSFVSATRNLEEPEDAFLWADLVRGTHAREGVPMRYALSNSFAFGGSNIAVVLEKV